jgi:hypothetical protein
LRNIAFSECVVCVDSDKASPDQPENRQDRCECKIPPRPDDGDSSPRRIATGRSMECSRIVKDRADDHRAGKPAPEVLRKLRRIVPALWKNVGLVEPFLRAIPGGAAPRNWG